MIYGKPTGDVFASQANTGESTEFPDVLRGWGITKEQTEGKPPMSWMNGAFKRVDENAEYLRQNGIPEWDEGLSYPVDAVTKVGSDFYLSKAENVGQSPLTSSNWEQLFFPRSSSSLLPVGVPVPYPASVPPSGFLKCNGAAFDTTMYPKLATIYPSGVLPDLRGEFIRGWDDGRGVDAGRAILSAQSHALQNITGSFNDVRFNSVPSTSGAFTSDYIGPASQDSTGAGYARAVNFDASRVVNTSTETRPRSIAFLYIVRAA